jgi:hypothetical protein
VDAREQRFGEIVHRLLPESPAHERGNRFILFGISAGNDGLARHAELPGGGKQRRARETAESQGKSKKSSFR